MSNPLSLIPLAAAAKGGSIDGLDARQLVAAGLTLLQRCAPLVRELAPGRGAVLLPNSPAYLVALAACEGRGALLLAPELAAEDVSRTLEAGKAHAVFTERGSAGSLAENVATVLLDELPGHVAFVHGSERRTVDVGSHFGLAIEGEEESEGSDEEAVVVRDPSSGGLRSLTHRELLGAARVVAEAARLAGADEVLALLPFNEARGIAAALLAPLLAGARVTTRSRSGGASDVDVIERGTVSVVASDPARLAAIARALHEAGRRLEAPALRLALSVGEALPAGVRDEWERTAGVELVEVSAPSPSATSRSAHAL